VGLTAVLTCWRIFGSRSQFKRCERRGWLSNSGLCQRSPGQYGETDRAASGEGIRFIMHLLAWSLYRSCWGERRIDDMMFAGAEREDHLGYGFAGWASPLTLVARFNQFERI
jgi:hypothetical protein